MSINSTEIIHFRPHGVIISPNEYKRLLKAEIRAIKFEEIAKNKATEIRKLQNQVASLNRQLSKRPVSQEGTHNELEYTDESNVIQH